MFFTRDLPQGYGIGQVRRESRLIDVYAHTGNGILPCIATQNIFNKDASCLSVTPVNIVTPLDGGFHPQRTY